MGRRAGAESGHSQSAGGLRPGGTSQKPDSGHAGTISISPYAPDQPERHETPDPLRSDAVKAQFHCVRQQVNASGSRPMRLSGIGGNTGAERAGLFAPRRAQRPRTGLPQQDYRSISRAMTSCWIWLVPS